MSKSCSYCIGAAFLATSFVAPGPASAATVTLSFTATVDNVYDNVRDSFIGGNPAPVLPTTVSVGETITGTLKYDTSLVADTGTGGSSDGTRRFVVLKGEPVEVSSIELSLGSYVWSTGNDPFEIYVKDGQAEDRLRFEYSNDDTGTSSFPFDQGINLITIDVSAISSGSDAPDFLSSNNLPQAGGDVNFDPLIAEGLVAVGSVTSDGANGGWGFTFEIDPSSLILESGLDTEDPPTPPPPLDREPSTYIYLDFDSGANVQVELIDGQYFNFSQGSRQNPSNVLRLEDRELIAQELQRIFDDTGATISVTLDRPPVANYITVEISGSLDPFELADDPGNPRYLRGTAYDAMNPLVGEDGTPIVLNGNLAGSGVDQFNQRPDANVAVFMTYDEVPDVNAGLYSLNQIAETAAHEVAHALGSVHIVDVPELDAVLQRTDPEEAGVVAHFYDAPIARRLGFNDAVSPDETHNPTYHILRYTDEANFNELQASLETPLQPGTWDLQEDGRQLSVYSVERGSFSDTGAVQLEVYAAYNFGGQLSVFADGEETDVLTAIYLGSLGPNSLLTLGVDKFSVFSLFAREAGSSVFDYFISNYSKAESNALLTVDDLGEGGLAVFRRSNGSLGYEFFEELSSRNIANYEVGPDGIARLTPVPIPGSVFLLCAGLASLLLVRGRALSS